MPAFVYIIDIDIVMPVFDRVAIEDLDGSNRPGSCYLMHFETTLN